MNRHAFLALSIAGSVAVTVLLWLILVPWDLSEVDDRSVTIAGGGDQLAPRIGSVLIVVTAAVAALAVIRPHGRVTAASIATATTWVLLFAWRASVSKTSGANLWLAGLVLVAIPCAAVSVGIVQIIRRAR